MKVTIGCESECAFFDKDGHPVDTLAVLNGGIASKHHSFEGITSDLGRSSLELISSVCESGEQVRSSLRRCVDMIPAGYRPKFSTLAFGKRVPIAAKPRYALVAQTLLREHPKGDQCIHMVAPWASTQFHLGVPSVMDPGSVLLLNFLNNIAPHARLAVLNRYGILGTEGHLDIWQGWSAPHRAPGPRWFADAQQLENFVGTIPK